MKQKTLKKKKKNRISQRFFSYASSSMKGVWLDEISLSQTSINDNEGRCQ